MRSVPTLRAHQYLYVARMSCSFSGEEHFSGGLSAKPSNDGTGEAHTEVVQIAR